MLIAHTPAKLHTELDALRTRGGRQQCVSLVTTRGEMHDGHGAVINAARTVGDIIVVAIMPPLGQTETADNLVTADQFQDIAFAERHETDVLYAPVPDPTTRTFATLDVKDLYSGPLHLDAPEATTLLEHVRILSAVQPDIVVWGERNYLEYRAVRQLITDLGLRTQIQCVPTVRHANGVAVSALDDELEEQERETLAILYQTLRNTAHAIRSGATNYSKVENTARIALKGAGFEIQYVKILDDHDLQPAGATTSSFRILCSVSLNSKTITDGLGLTL